MQNSVLCCEEFAFALCKILCCAVKNSLLRCVKFCVALCVVQNPLLRCEKFILRLPEKNCLNDRAKHGNVAVVVHRVSFLPYLVSVG